MSAHDEYALFYARSTHNDYYSGVKHDCGSQLSVRLPTAPTFDSVPVQASASTPSVSLISLVASLSMTISPANGQ